MKLMPLVLVLLLPLQGCMVLPIPHLENTSPQVLGRICDDDTKEGVKSAQIHFSGREKSSVKTDETGRFVLKPRTAFVLLTVFFADDQLDIPSPRTFPGAVLVTHPGYRTRCVPFAAYANQKPHSMRGDERVLDLGDVEMFKVSPQGGADGLQPLSSDTNATSEAAVPRRSP